MKHLLLIILLLAGASHSLAYSFAWGIGGSKSPLMLNGNLTTVETFTNAYELLLMDIGYISAPYSVSRGYATFLLKNTGEHTTIPGSINGSAVIIPGGSELNGRQFLLVLFEKATGKYFVLSESADGETTAPYKLSGITEDPFPPDPGEYNPTSPTGYFYKGKEIPPFCGWLSKHGLAEDDLTDLSTNNVNLAFAVNTDPTDFSGIALAITNITLSSSTFSGTFSFDAKNAAGTPTAVTTLRDPDALVIRTTDSLIEPFSTNASSSVSLDTGTFEVDATSPSQFLRLDFTPVTLW